MTIQFSKIKKADVVVGIPSFNEADGIEFVTKKIDLGLKKYFSSSKNVIINADNNSPDNTREAFLHVKTSAPKIYISTPPGVRGKGNNIYNLFKKAVELDGKIVIIIDADLKSIKPEWIKKLGRPIENDYDLAFPIYDRNEYDGSITNHICYPLIYGMLGHNIRQPIAGEFAFSRIFIDHMLKKTWTKNIKNYGIDIFITLSAIYGNFKMVEVDLRQKIHKPSAPKLGPMFFQVTDTLFRQIINSKKNWLKPIQACVPPLLYPFKQHGEPQKLSVDYKDLKQKSLYEFSLYYETLKEYLPPKIYAALETMYFQKKVLNIKPNLWSKILHETLYAYEKSGSKMSIIRALRPLYFGRTITFIKETLELSPKESEIKIQHQAEYFYKHRNYLLNKYK